MITKRRQRHEHGRCYLISRTTRVARGETSTYPQDVLLQDVRNDLGMLCIFPSNRRERTDIGPVRRAEVFEGLAVVLRNVLRDVQLGLVVRHDADDATCSRVKTKFDRFEFCFLCSDRALQLYERGIQAKIARVLKSVCCVGDWGTWS